MIERPSQNIFNKMFTILAALLIAFQKCHADDYSLQETPWETSNEAVAQAEEDDDYENYAFAPASITLRQNFGQSLGSSRAYTTLEGQLFVLSPFKGFQPFFDLRIHRFDDDTYASNEGLGLRYWFEGINKVVGVNFYHDYHNTKFNNFNQVGIGLELLGHCWASRLNGYLPIGLKYGTMRDLCIFDHYVGGYFAFNQEYETSFMGLDFEVERIFTFCNGNRLSLAAGPYYYFPAECETDIFGGRVSIVGNFWNYVVVAVSATHDNRFNTRVQAQIGITIPFWGDAEEFKCGCQSPLLYQPVRRQETIVRDCYCRWYWNW